jgi:hypothetical protein
VRLGLLTIGVLFLALSAVLFWSGSQGATPITGMPLLGTTSAGLLGVFVLAVVFGRRAFLASLVWLLPLLPALAAIGTVAADVSGLAKTGPEAVYDAILATAVLWMVIAAATTDRTRPSGAQVRAYSELSLRTDQLLSRLQVIAKDKGGEPAYQEACSALDLASGDLKSNEPGPQWASAIGYVNAWRAIHRSEEALIDVDEPSVVTAGALLDDLRLDGSTIPGRDRLVLFLHQALDEIDPVAATRYLQIRPSERMATAPDSIQELAHLRARAMLREVRRAINDFRDARTEDIIKTRNILRRTFAFAALVSYALLAVAVLVDTKPALIANAAGLFLIAALVGLFQRLNNTQVGQSTVDDFGLDDAQLLAGPLVSGIAGIGGVVLIAAAPVAAAAFGAVNGATTTGVAVPTLDFAAIFDIARNPLAVLVAAIFGLTPRLLLSRLESETARLKSDIRSSYVADKADGAKGSTG